MVTPSWSIDVADEMGVEARSSMQCFAVTTYAALSLTPATKPWQSPCCPRLAFSTWISAVIARSRSAARVDWANAGDPATRQITTTINARRIAPPRVTEQALRRVTRARTLLVDVELFL